jgi:hypothetical protein
MLLGTECAHASGERFFPRKAFVLKITPAFLPS